MRRLALFLVCTGLVLLSACVSPPRPLSSQAQSLWQGRMGITVYGQPVSQMSASFTLQGDAQRGELELFTPLGTTSALLRWSATQTTWQHGHQTESFDDLQDLTQQALGATLPVQALFDWIHGQATPAQGWSVDLSQFQDGRIQAQRTEPLPQVSLRIHLD